MRRLKIAALAAAFALPLSATPAAALAQQEAFAVWLRPEGKKLVAYFAVAQRYVDPPGGGVVTVAGVAKGTCRVSGGRRFKMILCSAKGPLKEIPFEDFVVDPTLGTATMTVRIASEVHDVTWTSTDRAPSAGVGAEVAPQGVGAGAGMRRSVRADGTLFGRNLTARRHFDFSDLSQSAGAGVGLPTRSGAEPTFSFRATISDVRSLPGATR